MCLTFGVLMAKEVAVCWGRVRVGGKGSVGGRGLRVYCRGVVGGCCVFSVCMNGLAYCCLEDLLCGLVVFFLQFSIVFRFADY